MTSDWHCQPESRCLCENIAQRWLPCRNLGATRSVILRAFTSVIQFAMPSLYAFVDLLVAVLRYPTCLKVGWLPALLIGCNLTPVASTCACPARSGGMALTNLVTPIHDNAFPSVECNDSSSELWPAHTSSIRLMHPKHISVSVSLRILRESEAFCSQNN